MTQEAAAPKDPTLHPTDGANAAPTAPPAEAPKPSEAELLSRAWLALPEPEKCRFLKQVNEKAPKMLENWMLHAGVAGMKRVAAAKREGDSGAKLDAFIADLGRARVWAFLFVDWFKHLKTYFNDFCTKVQQELAVAGCATEQIEPRMIDALRERYKGDPFLELFVATLLFHNHGQERE